MSRPTVKIAALVTAIVVVAVIATKSSSRAESKPTRHDAIDVSETTEARIERAMSAGPPEIARSAKIIDKDEQGHTVILREGSLVGCLRFLSFPFTRMTQLALLN